MKNRTINRISALISILFLGAASIIQMINELLYHFFNAGNLKYAMSQMPGATVGFFEAHGLAFIWVVYFSIKLKQKAYREIHVFAIAVHSLLGFANSIYWNDIFVRFDQATLGVVSTALHFVLIVLHTIALSAINDNNHEKV